MSKDEKLQSAAACHNCRHWRRPEAGSHYGECALDKESTGEAQRCSRYDKRPPDSKPKGRGLKKPKGD